MSKTAIVPFAALSSTLAGVPCTMLILAAKLASFDCCHLLIFLSSQKKKLHGRASKTGLIMRLPRREVYGAMQVHQLVRPWEDGQGRKHNACGNFGRDFANLHCDFTSWVPLCQLFLSRAFRLWQSLFRCCPVSLCADIAEFLHMRLSERSRTP